METSGMGVHFGTADFELLHADFIAVWALSRANRMAHGIPALKSRKETGKKFFFFGEQFDI